MMWLQFKTTTLPQDYQTFFLPHKVMPPFFSLLRDTGACLLIENLFLVTFSKKLRLPCLPVSV